MDRTVAGPRTRCVKIFGLAAVKAEEHTLHWQTQLLAEFDARPQPALDAVAQYNGVYQDAFTK